MPHLHSGGLTALLRAQESARLMPERRLHLGLPDLREDPVGTVEWPARDLREGMILVVKLGDGIVGVTLDSVRTVGSSVLCEARIFDTIIRASADVDSAVKVVQSEIDGF